MGAFPGHTVKTKSEPTVAFTHTDGWRKWEVDETSSLTYGSRLNHFHNGKTTEKWTGKVRMEAVFIHLSLLRKPISCLFYLH